jgi:spermidine synthase
MDSVRQSYVDLTDPAYLDFEYVQLLASVLSMMPPGPLAVTHIGGGGLTLPRYVEAVRPSSTQIVLEPDVELTDLIRRDLPLPRRHRIRIRTEDGWTGIARLANRSADVVILDAFADGRIPAELTTVEFFTDVSRILRGSGLFLANVVDEPGLRYAGRVIAGLRVVFGSVALVAGTDVLRNRRFGNLVLAAAAEGLAEDDMRRAIAKQPFPAGVRGPSQLARRFGGFPPFTEADRAESPEPFRGGWRVH